MKSFIIAVLISFIAWNACAETSEKYLVFIDNSSVSTTLQDGKRTSFKRGEVVRVEKYKGQQKSDFSQSELNNIVVVMELTKTDLKTLTDGVKEDVVDAKGIKTGEIEIEPRKYRVDVTKLSTNSFVEEPDVQNIISSLIAD